MSQRSLWPGILYGFPRFEYNKYTFKYITEIDEEGSVMSKGKGVLAVMCLGLMP